MTQIISSIQACTIVAVDSFPEYQMVHAWTNKNILIMGETDSANYKLFDHKRTEFAIRNTNTIRILGELNKGTSIHIFLNTGMNREWLTLEKLPNLLEKIKSYPNLKVTGVMSHLACSDEVNHPLNQIQYDRFKQGCNIIRKYGHKPKYIHLEATAGMMNEIDKDWVCSAWRLWIWLYGYDPLVDLKKRTSLGLELKPALDVYSTVIGVQEIVAGESIGYSASWICKEKTTIATFWFGYREGLSRSLSGSDYKILIKNTACPLVGRVSMNYSTADASKLGDIQLWDPVLLISSNVKDPNTIYTFSSIAKTIPYEILVKLDDKIKRQII